MGDSGKLYPDIICNNLVHIILTSANGTTPVVLFSGAPRYVIRYYRTQVDFATTIASAGLVSASYSDSSYGEVIGNRFWIPQNMPSIQQPTNAPQDNNNSDFWWNNKTANSTLSVGLSTALTAGAVRIAVRYALVNFVN